MGGNQVFMYDDGNAHWGVDNVMRFAYAYDSGQWMDYRPEWGWNLMGDSGLSAVFIGDGAWHSFDSNDQVRYDGSYGWWQVNSADMYRLNYPSGQWQYYSSGPWYDEAVYYYTDWTDTQSYAHAMWGRYIGDSMFLLSTTQNGNIYYDICDKANGNYEAFWAGFDPGSDGVVNPSEWRLVFIRNEWPNEWENTLEDTLVISNYDYQDWTGGPGSGITGFVDAIGLIARAHGCQFDIVGVSEHAAPDYLIIGDHLVIDSSNVSSYSSEFVEWGTYMDSEAEIQFYGCQLAGSTAGRVLVDTIAGYTGSQVWACDDYTGACSTSDDLYAGGPDPYESIDWRLEYSSAAGHGTYHGGTALTIYDLVYTPTSILNGWV